MTALAQSVTIDNVTYPAGTDHTTMPVDIVDRIRNDSAWVGGTAPTASAAAADRRPLRPSQLSTVGRLRAALGLSISDAPYQIPTTTGAVTIDRANGRYQYATLTGNVTLTVAAGTRIGDELTLALTQDATGSRTLTLGGTNVKPAGGALVLTTTAAKADVIALVWTGSAWREKSRALNS
jgi:hypothetical protein